MASKMQTSVYQSPKCFVTYGSMGHTDPKQLPRKGKPWSNLRAMRFLYKVDLIIPQENVEAIRERVSGHTSTPTYQRVNMSLDQILHGEFFTEYIKRGNILMLSEGMATNSDIFMLREGVLTMFLSKDVYERTGLVGKPHGIKGQRGPNTRWVVSYDLRGPSMLHGKKGFDRLVYAAKKVLSRPLTWLFCNVDTSTPTPDPLEPYFPVKFTSVPGVTEAIRTKGAPLSVTHSILASGDRSELEMDASEIYEWLSLIRLGSPRIEVSDNADPYISRYQAPGGGPGQMSLCKMSWQGFFSSSWLVELLAAVITACPSQGWFALNATEFSQDGSSVSDEIALLRPPESKGEFLMWEIKSAE